MRITFLDYLRVIACFMVMLVHSCEPFYLGGEGTLILTKGDALWVTFIDGAIRAAVPLFMLASSYLLFPIKDDSKTFFKKRFKRVVIPFVIWLLLYAFVPQYGSEVGTYANGDLISTIKHLIFNFVDAGGHLWFVYMLLGIYIIMPLLSPWAETVSKKKEEAFLLLWFFTTMIPFFRLAADLAYGQPRVWGEAFWNEFGTFYGVSGFIGYLVMGHYIRKYVPELSWGKTLCITLPSLAVGYAISAGWFWCNIPSAYPVSGPIGIAVLCETSWNFTTTGVALMTIGYFLLIRKCTDNGRFYKKIIMPISRCSYGMYLMHIFFLTFWFSTLHEAIASTPVVIFLTATCTYISSFILSLLLSYIPKIGKYLVG